MRSTSRRSEKSPNKIWRPSGGAIYPLYSLQAEPFSDTFLLAALAMTLALLASTALNGKPKEQEDK